MNDLDIRHRPTTHAITLPPPRMGEIIIRKAMLPPAGGADLMFIDGLQKQHAKMVGFMPRGQLEKNIADGNVLIAQNPATTERIGYVIFKDKYFKREDLGIIYQLNVAPHRQRGLVGAALVKAAFERCPWGVKLFCLWCAQDLEANRFWESIGFVPIAFRSGSRGKEHGGKRKEGRMQIMWQKRIREGDVETPYWYPTETSGGAMKENRIVLPMDPRKHWSDELPFVLPEELPGGEAGEPQAASPKAKTAAKALAGESRKSKSNAAGAVPPPARPKRGLWFATGAPTSSASRPSEAVDAKALAVADKPRRERRRNDAKHIAFAREVRDRYLEEVNSGRLLLTGESKYDVARLPTAAADEGMLLGDGASLRPTPLLEAA